MQHLIKTSFLAFVLLISTHSAYSVDLSYQISLKQPGNPSVAYRLNRVNGGLVAQQSLPLSIKENVEKLRERFPEIEADIEERLEKKWQDRRDKVRRRWRLRLPRLRRRKEKTEND